MKTHTLVVLLILKGTTLKAIGHFSAIGAETAALGGIGFMSNYHSSSNHHALMPWLEKPGIACSMANYWGVKNLNQFNCSGVVPYKTFGYGFGLYNFGNADYAEQGVQLSVAHAFHKRLSVGLGANYNSFRIANYGHKSVFLIDASLAAKVNDKVMLAFKVFNPYRAKLNDYADERIQTVYSVGLQYKINAQVKSFVQLEKANAFQPNLKLGIDYSPKSFYHLRFGFSSIQPQFSFGAGFKHKKVVIDFASTIHPMLGINSQLSFAYAIGH
ncbi:MAG: hypothetical protein PSX81_07215 [bacterium]|nr:hypothetical protein [bacterium]